MSYAFDIVAINFGSNELYGGLNNNFTMLEMQNDNDGTAGIPYGGVASNFDAITADQSDFQAIENQEYFGINTNFDTQDFSSTSSAQMDNQPILLHPKDQRIYYKLYGYNPNTTQYETWIISEEIVPRPETFNPSGSPPNEDLNVYYTPPSGNPLVNVKIIGRWIQ